MQELRELTARALEDVRRVSLDLRPTILDDLGLAPALEWRVDEFNKADGLRATIAIKGMDQRLPRETELMLYRIGQESLSNVSRHAQAAAVEVSLIRADGLVTLDVRDDGVGFDPLNVEPAAGHGLGLVGMRERVAMVGGESRVDAAPGQGTHITASVLVATEEKLTL